MSHQSFCPIITITISVEEACHAGQEVMGQGNKRLGESALLSIFWGVDRSSSGEAGMGGLWTISIAFPQLNI
jgi:hypothetical protein